MTLKKNGILDPEGKYRNPLTGKKYSENYIKESLGAPEEGKKGWVKFPVYKALDKNLPERIIKLIKEKQVVIIEAGTGGGKTVLIPKYALHAVDYKGKVVVTTPKQLTTSSNAEYSAKLLDVEIGEEVGYQHGNVAVERTNKETGETEIIKKMKSDKTKLLFSTDGSLVENIKKDPKAKEFDIIIIDEAHERTLGIDELLVLLRDALRLNPKLKLIIMSATLPEGLFENYFKEFDVGEEKLKGAVTFPVETIYSKKTIPDNKRAEEAINILFSEIINKNKPGDVLIFVTSISEGKKLEPLVTSKRKDVFCISLGAQSKDTDKDLATELTLYKEKYKEKGYNRKVVFGTNVVESSVTIKDLKYVIDPGLQLKADYNPLKMASSLKLNRISKAQAQQRKGRTGRTVPGVCYRIDTLKEYEEKPEDPRVDILTTDLTTKFFNYMSMEINETLLDVIRFIHQFIEPPSRDMIREGFRTIYNLGLLTDPRRNRYFFS